MTNEDEKKIRLSDDALSSDLASSSGRIATYGILDTKYLMQVQPTVWMAAHVLVLHESDGMIA